MHAQENKQHVSGEMIIDQRRSWRELCYCCREQGEVSEPQIHFQINSLKQTPIDRSSPRPSVTVNVQAGDDQLWSEVHSLND